MTDREEEGFVWQKKLDYFEDDYSRNENNFDCNTIDGEILYIQKYM